MLFVQSVERARHRIKSPVRVDHDDLRRLEALAGLQLPAEILRVDPHRHAHAVKLRHLRLCAEIPGIHEVHRVDLTVLLRGIFVHQRQERVILMAGLPAERTDILNAVSQRLSLDMALPRPASVQGHHIIIPVIHINARRVHPGKVKMFFACVGHLHASRDHIDIVEYGVQQLHLHADISVRADQLQCSAFLLCAERRRKPVKLWFSRDDLMGHIGEHAAHMSARRPDTDTAFPVVAKPTRRILKGKTVVKRAALPVIPARDKRGLPCPHQISGLRLPQFPAVIDMSDKILLVHNADHIGRIRRIQLEYPLFLIVCYHACSPFHAQFSFLII